MTANALTLLALTGIGVPPYSARGLHQTLQPIADAAQTKRTINGALVDVSDVLFRKYSSQISGADVDPPAIEAVWPGLQLTVDCIAELAVAESTEPVFARTVVGSRTEAGFIFYRPRLVMLVTDFSINIDEYGKASSWSMNLEEV